jgi:hypothetical protein
VQEAREVRERLAERCEERCEESRRQNICGCAVDEIRDPPALFGGQTTQDFISTREAGPNGRQDRTVYVQGAGTPACQLASSILHTSSACLCRYDIICICMFVFECLRMHVCAGMTCTHWLYGLQLALESGSARNVCSSAQSVPVATPASTLLEAV